MSGFPRHLLPQVSRTSLMDAPLYSIWHKVHLYQLILLLCFAKETLCHVNRHRLLNLWSSFIYIKSKNQNSPNCIAIAEKLITDNMGAVQKWRHWEREGGRSRKVQENGDFYCLRLQILLFSWWQGREGGLKTVVFAVTSFLNGP